MAYVITGSCIKDDSCIEVCPVDCIHPKQGAPDFETAEQLYIDPDVCIDCDACVEACPAGAYAAHCLLRARGDAEIDLFERLPTPWGLLRGGVAPDHQEIKRLEETFERETLARGCRFVGNVEVGVDVSHSELMRHYAAVVYATGAQTDKSLGIPGEDLPGSWAATEFVAWYNGHPDYRDLTFDLDVERAVVLGRRGPAQAAFTSAELRELGNMDGVAIAVDDVTLDPVSERWLDEEGT